MKWNLDFLCILPCLKRSALCTVRKKISWEVFYQNVHQPSRFWRVTYFPRHLAWHSLTMALFTKVTFVLASKYGNHWNLIPVNSNMLYHFKFGLHSNIQKKNLIKVRIMLWLYWRANTVNIYRFIIGMP